MLDSVLHSLSNNCGVDTDVAGGVQDHLLLFCFVDVALTLEWMMFLLTCDKKLTKSQLSPTHADYMLSGFYRSESQRDALAD